MKRICIVIGTRPEAIKMAPVIRAFKDLKHSGFNLDLRVCVTAQHRQMLDQVLSLFQITPDYDLNIMRQGQDLTDVTARVIVGMRDVLQDFKPHVVMVHGDTTTTFAASLAAYYEKIPVAHVEAGLRTGNIYSPWPEEMNRRLAGSLANLHFAPTESAKRNLILENINDKAIYVTGNTVIDALLHTVSLLNSRTELREAYDDQFAYLDKSKRLILVTGHRRENFGEGFESICKALVQLSRRNDVEIVYPVHLNPNVQEPVRRMLTNESSIHLIQPLDYLPFVYLMNRSYLVLTDSGGIQEEAPSLGKPVLVMRDTTERPEGVDSGTVRLVGTDEFMILSEANALLDNVDLYNQMSASSNPYGDGHSATRIASIITDY